MFFRISGDIFRSNLGMFSRMPTQRVSTRRVIRAKLVCDA